MAELLLSEVQALLATRGLAPEAKDGRDVPILGVSQDSRTVAEGDLFLAWKGVAHDAHEHVAAAEAQGAAAAIVERFVDAVRIPQVRVRDGRLAGALAADQVFGSPWTGLFVFAVTGTNGKTTTTLMARHLLGMTEPVAIIGTLGVVGPDGLVREGTEGLTTPGPVQLARWIRELADEGVRALGVEASSHALEQRRLDALRFGAGAFTNLSQDHLDYHTTLAGYRSAKVRLLELLEPDGTAVVNRDEPAWEGLPLEGRREIGVGIESSADLRASEVALRRNGAAFRLEYGGHSALVELPLLGRFNVENALVAAGLALAAGRSLEDVAAGLSGVPQVPGRLEVVVTEPCTVIIDFAHTPAALERVLATLRPLVPGRLIVVFGAGGDRDRTKRPGMGKVVEAGADLAIVTSDNPRTEDPEAIIDDIARGMTPGRHRRIPDRRAAIREALEVADPSDLVLLAGKGHERYQVLGRDKVHFDEREVVREILEGWRAA